jgi:hypothetical protein
MVPVNSTALARSFAAQLADLRHGIRESWHAEAPEAGLVEWAAFRSGTQLETGAEPLAVTTIPARRRAEAPILAAVGFRLPLPATTDGAAGLWLDGMRRLMTRDPVPADRNSFFFRPVELLGLAVGASALAGKDETPLRWLRELLESRRDDLPRSGTWAAALEKLTAWHTGAHRAMNVHLEPLDAIDTAVLLWLHLIDDGMASAATSVTREALSQQLLEYASSTLLRPQGLGQRGILCVALQRAVAEAVGDLRLGGLRTTELVVTLCRRFPLLIAEMQKRHNHRQVFAIADEYDLQDLLRGILSLHFDDIRPEEGNPSHGAVQSRSDLFLKPERIVIETKMTRKSLSQRELVHQLIQDKAQYQGHPGYTTLICFVYDPGHFLANPTAIEHDLSGQDGGLTTIVVISPRGL